MVNAMSQNIPTDWLYPSSLETAIIIQKQLSARVSTEDDLIETGYIAGMDVSNNLYDPLKMIYASGVICDSHQCNLITQYNASIQQHFPYIPGFLGFREVPALINVYQQFKLLPKVILVDGHGVSHPRGLGIASHIGVLIDCPTIGVAKTILIGQAKFPVGTNPGDLAPLIWKNKIIAMLVRTKKNALPLIISSGHRVSLDTSVQIVLQCLRGYRLPEPTRLAHLAANDYRKKESITLIEPAK